MEEKKCKIKYFLLGCGSGVLLTAIAVLGVIIFYVGRDTWDDMMPGYIDKLHVGITSQPSKGYDWSLDISQEDRMMVQVGKLTGSQQADRCKILDLDGTIVAYIVWDDPEAKPGLSLFNNKRPVLGMIFGEKGLEHSLTYGPYGFDPDIINAGDTGYVDMDFDGQFDVKEIFNEDGKTQKTLISLNGEWKEVIRFNRKISTAEVQELDKVKVYIFKQGSGWSLQE